MTSIIERSFKVMEQLAAHPDGRPLSALSSDLHMPLSATHRLLAELMRNGYVRQDHRHGDYLLTVKLVSLGLGFLIRFQGGQWRHMRVIEPPVDQPAAVGRSPKLATP